MVNFVDESAVGIATVSHAPTEIPQPPSAQSAEKPPATATDSSSPEPEAPREPSPKTVAMVMESVVPTFEQMMGKPQAVDDIEFELPQPDGTTITCKAHLVAIDGPAYDELQGKHLPTPGQRARNMAFNQDTFGPALLAKVVQSPAFTEAQWNQLWHNPNWSGGELASLFWSANGLCLKGLNVPLHSSG